MLTLADLTSLVIPITGGMQASQLAPDVIVNSAARWLTNCRDWVWAIRPPVSLSLTGSQDYIELPSDFAKVAAIQGQDINRDICLVTPARLLELRQISGQFDGPYYAAVFSAPQSSQTATRGAYRLYVWPEPTDSASNVFSLTYYGEFAALTNPNQYPDMPEFMGDLLQETVVKYAKGCRDGSLAAALAELRENPLYQDAIDRDGSTQGEVGPIRNGITQRTFVPNPYYGTVTGP